jgi:hypothetical protein
LLLTLLAAIHDRCFLAGVLFSLSVFGRVSNVMAAPAFFYLLLTGKSPAKSLLKFAAAGVPVLLVFGLTNWEMYGGPLELSYFHQSEVVNGSLVVTSQSQRFSVNPLQGLAAILFDRQLGFFVSYPVAALAYLLGSHRWKQAQPRLAIACAVIALGFIAFYAPYSGAVYGGGGMRHFLPLIALSAVPLSFIVERLVQMSSHARRAAG